MTQITLNISDELRDQANDLVSRGAFNSVDDVFAAGLKDVLAKHQLTENGFTVEFEQKILDAAAEPVDDSPGMTVEEHLEQVHRLAKQIRSDKSKTR